jgi:macrolide-specific efflux system membrane fusion protein
MTRKKKIWLYGGIGILVVATASYFILHRSPKQKFTYHEDEVVRDDFIETIVSTGTVAPENRLDIKPPVAGRMEKLLVTEGEHVKQGQVLAWVSSTERAAMLDSARAEGESSLKQWETYYKPTPIYAPINGVIILQNIWPGQSFATTDAILTMSDRLSVKAQVDETDIAKVTLGQDAEVALDAYPGQKIEAKVGHVAFDSKTVNSVTTYIVDVLPQKVPKTMLSGMTANVTFILKSIPDSLLIPNEAIQTEKGASCVRLKPAKEDDPLVCQPVTLGPTTEGQTVVTEGLTEGQKIMIPDLKPIGLKNMDASKNPFFNGQKPGGRGGPR